MAKELDLCPGPHASHKNKKHVAFNRIYAVLLHAVPCIITVFWDDVKGVFGEFMK